MTELADIYGKDFFDSQFQGSLASARVYLGRLRSVWSPSSVVDFGCGRGAWLAAWRELGVKHLVGIDGEWVSGDTKRSDAMQFLPYDLNNEVKLAERFDLAMSVEVAEHVEPRSSDTFFRSLSNLSDAILFGAAFTGQPGANHINTRPHSFWASKFLASGYQIFDLFRPQFWSDERVEPWYRQNTFMYVKPAHPLAKALIAAGERPSADARFVDAVHPFFHMAALEELMRLQRAVARSQAPEISPVSAPQEPPRDAQAAAIPATQPMGRNERCFCGSGKRYKHCHGMHT